MKLALTSFLCAAFALASTADAQDKKNKLLRPPVQPTVVVAQPTPEKATTPGKRNGRPPGGEGSAKPGVLPAASTHFYEFTRPGFTYGRIVIEHNDQGKGTISFLKDGHDEIITDPIQLSAVTVAKLASVLTELNFLNSVEEYQFQRDFSHMGNVSFTLRRDGRARTVKYNWTDNAAAKALMDEYRRIGNEYTWKFEILLARENFPLQTPGLMDAIDGYIKRNEISDPANLLPFLTELSNDERLPLMARNRATKLIDGIRKSKEVKK